MTPKSPNPFSPRAVANEMAANLNEMLAFATPEEQKRNLQRLQSAKQPKHLLTIISANTKLQTI
ncbi:MAG: hypothetical protein RLZZ267_713 [Bacillota bacterium]|jgi:hypothetical protein